MRARTARLAVIFSLFAGAAALTAETTLVVTVTDKKTGAPVKDLRPQEFRIRIGNTPRRVLAAEYETGPVDVVLMLDTSLIGGQISSLAPSLIRELDEKEQMAIVAYHSAADLIQEFTSSKDLLRRALGTVEFGNSPRLLDALYAVAADGFEGSVYRRVILLLTSGVDGPSRVTREEVARICRRNGVSIYPVYMMNYGRSVLEKLARVTAGAAFNARELARRSTDPAARVFEVMRGRYRLTLAGNLPLGDKAKVEIQRKGKYFASYLEME